MLLLLRLRKQLAAISSSYLWPFNQKINRLISQLLGKIISAEDTRELSQANTSNQSYFITNHFSNSGFTSSFNLSFCQVLLNSSYNFFSLSCSYVGVILPQCTVNKFGNAAFSFWLISFCAEVTIMPGGKISRLVGSNWEGKISEISRYY